VNEIDCAEFLSMFLLLGHSERAKAHAKHLQKQREESKQREDENRKKVLLLETRAGYSADPDSTQVDIDSAMEKLGNAAEVNVTMNYFRRRKTD